MAVHDAAVGLYDGTDIAQSFHAAFDFKGRNAGIHECIDIFEAVQILQAQDIASSFSKDCRLSSSYTAGGTAGRRRRGCRCGRR
mgnify:CR=1 FL=1